MSITIDQFWKCTAESGLLSLDLCGHLAGEWAGMKGAMTRGSARATAQWLIAEGKITDYQAAILLAGQPGPFNFGGYRVTDRIESGRLAGLFRAAHVATGHPVLLQFIPGAVGDDASRWAAVVAELAGMAVIIQPNLCRWHEANAGGQYRFTVCEPLAGESLDRMLRGGNVLPVEEACRIAILAAVGLAHLHARGQVHGEIRPANAWIEPHGNVRLLTGTLAHDPSTPPGHFDLAITDRDASMRGTVDYLAPELARRLAVPSAAGDQYALGCTLYAMLAGRPPFAGETAAEKVQQHVIENVPTIRRAKEKVSPKLRQVLMKMMAKDWVHRFATLGEAAEALATFVPADKITPQTEEIPGTLAAYQATLASGRREPASAQVQEPVVGPHMPTAKGLAQNASSTLAVPNSRGAHSGIGIGSKPQAVVVALPPVERPVLSESAEFVRRTQRRTMPSWPVYLGVCIGVIALAIAVIFSANLWIGHSETPEPGESGQQVAAGTSSLEQSDGETMAKSQPVGNTARETVIEDDGQTLWVSPTSGPAVHLTYLPPGGQTYIILRPAQLLTQLEGDKISAALGPWGDFTQRRLEATIGCPIDDVDRLIIGIAGTGTTQQLTASYVAYLAEGQSAGSLAARQERAVAKMEGADIFTEKGRAYYVPPAMNDRILIIGPTDTMPAIIHQGITPSPLRPDMERLLADTDADRHVTILLAPNFLFADGQAMLSGPGERLRKPLSWLIGDGVNSVALSMHWGDNFFVELRLAGTLDAAPRDLAEQFQDRLREIPSHIEASIFSQSNHAYSRSVLARFPAMLRKLASYTRTGQEQNQAILRAYLPLPAGHNLLMASELALAEASRVKGTTATAATKPAAAKDIRSLLKKPISLSFPRDTLEMAIKMLSDDCGIEMVILGADLQLEGITKNQSFGLDMRDKPVEEILLKIMRLANPDKAATGPADPRQKLLYIVKPKSPSGPNVLFVTTRAQAKKRGDTIPEVFRLQE